MIYGSLHFSQLLALSTCFPPDSSKYKSYFFELAINRNLVPFWTGENFTLAAFLLFQ